MEKINRDNYEIFFLDYMEGKLNSEQKEDLFKFLDINPDLKEEFSLFEIITLDKEEIIFDAKDELIKPEVTHYNYDHYLISDAEGDIKSSEKRALDSFLNLHHEYKKESKVYNKLKATPDYSVSYIAKEKLKKADIKPTGKIIYFYRSLAVAASVILAAFLFIQINNSEVDKSIAKVNTEEPQKVKVENNSVQKDEGIASVNPNENKDEEGHELIKEMELKLPTTHIAKVNTKLQKVTNTQIAVETHNKIESIRTESEDLEKIQAPVFEIAEKPELPDVIEQIENNQNLAQAAVNVVENIVTGEQNQYETSTASNVVDLATAGINKLTGKELVSFEKQYNEEGKMKKFQISAGNFGFSRSTSR